VGLVALAEAERRGEVACEHVDLLDVGQESLVDGLLVCCPAGRDLLLLYVLSIIVRTRLVSIPESIPVASLPA